jgi:hypothetical protein
MKILGGKKLRLCVGYVTSRPAYTSTIKSKSIKLWKKKGVNNKVKCTAEFEIEGTSLTKRRTEST